MAFKSFSQYKEEKQGEGFILSNDGDYADVVFLYRSVNDVLVADVHYISSATYNGYAHCCGTGCPACNYPTKSGRGIRLDHKIFIPLYNISKGKIEFWDRSTFFENVLETQVFKNYPNPSETVFRITRKGEAGSRDTRYEIMPVGRNSAMPYEKILADCGMTLPEGYSNIVREMSIEEMSAALSPTGGSDLQDYGYVPVPRGSSADNSGVTVDTPEYSAPPSDLPPIPDEVAAPELPDYTPESSEPASSDDDLDDVSF